ncbi:hypothetical protein D3C71_1180190 [compost metagenome]
MQAQQQRTEGTARTLGIGEADNHEFLSMLALELDPVAATPGHVRRSEALADQAFHAHLAGAVEQGFRVFAEGIGKAQQRIFCGFEYCRQRGATLLHRHLAQIDAIEVRQIKQVINNVAAATGFESVLQRLKIRHALFVRHHHFTVQPGGFQTQARQCLGLAGQLVGPVVAVAREEFDFIMVNARHDPIAVEFDLVAPLTVGCFFHQRRQFRFDLFR